VDRIAILNERPVFLRNAAPERDHVMKFLRGIVCGIALSAVAVVSASGPSQAQDKVVRIGFQKYGKLVLLKRWLARGEAETARLQSGVDRISGRPAIAGSGQRRRDRFRQYR
jgi:hypothetical protein